MHECWAVLMLLDDLWQVFVRVRKFLFLQVYLVILYEFERGEISLFRVIMCYKSILFH